MGVVTSTTELVWFSSSTCICLFLSLSLSNIAARAWLFIGFLFAFGGLIGSLWIFIQQFLVPGQLDTQTKHDLHTLNCYQLLYCPSQCLLSFCSCSAFG